MNLSRMSKSMQISVHNVIKYITRLAPASASQHGTTFTCSFHQQPPRPQRTQFRRYRKEVNNKHLSRGNRHFSAQTMTFENQPPSWLFVSDAVAGAYGAQVNLDLDLERILGQHGQEKLKANLNARGLDFDVESLVELWNKMLTCVKLKEELHAQKDRVIEELKKLKTEPQNPSPECQASVDDLVRNLSRIKKELADNAFLWDIEEQVMLTALKLPNALHETTPLQESVVTRQTEYKTEIENAVSHIDIARQNNLIQFSNVGPKAYYLQGELVQAEMALTDYVCNFLRSQNFRQIAGPEFFKTPVMEGCGLDVHNADEVLTMLDQVKDVIEPMNHLAGVSTAMFAAYVAKTCIGDNILPFNMFACGRTYKNSRLPGLFGAVQSTQAGVFSCVKTTDVDQQFEETTNVLWNLLEPFGFPLSACQICARDLRPEERRRVEIHMFAPSLAQSIPIASVSELGEYVSRRLMVTHNQNHADIRSAQLVSMISGMAVNVTSLLAIWMEHSYLKHKHQAMPFSLHPLPVLQRR